MTLEEVDEQLLQSCHHLVAVEVAMRMLHAVTHILETATANQPFLVRQSHDRIDVERQPSTRTIITMWRTRLQETLFHIDHRHLEISSAKCIDEYTEKSRWPFHSHQLDLVKDYLYIIGVPYKSINVNSSLDNLSQKMVRGFLAEYFTGQKPLQRVLQICHQITSVLPLPTAKIQDTYLYMLKQLQRGILPQSNNQAPILLGKDEVVLWCYDGVTNVMSFISV